MERFTKRINKKNCHEAEREVNNEEPGRSLSCPYHILYIKMNVCLYFIQIHISKPIGTKLCTRLPLGLEKTLGYVWARNS
jgi:hypothetical protein